jgi:predicted nucleic acid-binding protein
MTFRIVVDTNLIISALFWGGQPEQLILLVASGKVTMLTTPELAGDYHRSSTP